MSVRLVSSMFVAPEAPQSYSCASVPESSISPVIPDVNPVTLEAYPTAKDCCELLVLAAVNGNPLRSTCPVELPFADRVMMPLRWQILPMRV